MDRVFVDYTDQQKSKAYHSFEDKSIEILKKNWFGIVAYLASFFRLNNNEILVIVHPFQPLKARLYGWRRKIG